MYKNYSQKNKISSNKDKHIPSIGMIAFFSQHKVASNLLMILLILFGIFGLSQLKRQLMPDFGIEIVNINIQWPGASAEDVEENIINAIEPEVRFINGVNDVDAFAYEGRGKISVGFDDSVSMSKALTDVQSAVARIATFPQDIEKPVISQVVQRDEVCRIDISGPFSNKALKYFARQMRDDLINMGLANVEFEGARDQEIWIEVPSDNLRELDLSLEDISNRLAASSIDLPSGSINSGGTSRQIRSEQLARSPNELRKIEVLSKSSGEKLYLRDIANVYETFEENSPYRINNKGPSIGLVVYRTQGSDSLTSQQLVEEYMDDIAGKYPQSLEIILYDIFADSVKQRINMLIDNGATGLILVLIVLFFFLNGRIAFWVALGIPVAFLAALGGMHAMGLSLDMISMFALIMGIGIVVDDAIVVSEHTTPLHRRG
ncbi:MAG: efflux RND transporter permease subunit, partial [Gammaproteobacteria bacterium]|nr:efflux RND transporter permease subunit [Gammaproteobacteria bacterium]